MKKKLKDFTQEELDEICDKYKNCENCPFNIKYETWCYALCRDILDLEIEYENEKNKKT